jgi:hypothetical protein
MLCIYIDNPALMVTRDEALLQNSHEVAYFYVENTAAARMRS